MTFAENLRSARQARGLTQESLGEALGMSPQAVSKWERGECMPDAALLPPLADILGVSLDRLFGRSGARFEDAAAAAQGWLLSLDQRARWNQALRLGQDILTAVSGMLDDPRTKAFAPDWTDERERDTSVARAGGFALFFRRPSLSCFTLFPLPEGGWGKVLEEDRPALWEALADPEVRKALRAVYGEIGRFERADRSFLDRFLRALGLADPEGALAALEELRVVKRRQLWLDGRETEVFEISPHVNLLQLLLMGNAVPWGSACFVDVGDRGTAEETPEGAG